MRKRKFSPNSSHAELSDVNEQELAKDGESLFCENRKSGTDTQKGESAPDFVVKAPTKNTAVVKFNTGKPTQRRSIRRENSTNASEKAQNSKVSQEKYEDEYTPLRKSGKSPLARIYGAVIVLCVLASIVMLVFTSNNSNIPSPTDTDTNQVPSAEDSSADTEIPQPSTNTDIEGADGIYKNGVKSTVSVISTKDGEKQIYSGFAIFDGGYIATLYEAVGEDNLKIVTHDGKSYPAELVGADPSVNLALLKSDGAHLEPLSTQNTQQLTLGESVFAIGNLGNEQYISSLITGEVAYLDRQASLMFPDGIERQANTLQLSSLTPKGMGGCPIFDRYGKVVALMLATGTDAEASLAYDINDVIQVLHKLKDGEPPSKEALYTLAFAPAKLGIFGEQTIEDGLWGISVKGFSHNGSDASLKLCVGDLIYKCDNTLVGSVSSFSELLSGHVSGDTIEIFVLRKSQRLSFFVTLS